MIGRLLGNHLDEDLDSKLETLRLVDSEREEAAVEGVDT